MKFVIKSIKKFQTEDESGQSEKFSVFGICEEEDVKIKLDFEQEPDILIGDILSMDISEKQTKIGD